MGNESPTGLWNQLLDTSHKVELLIQLQPLFHMKEVFKSAHLTQHLAAHYITLHFNTLHFTGSLSKELGKPVLFIKGGSTF